MKMDTLKTELGELQTQLDALDIEAKEKKLDEPKQKRYAELIESAEGVVKQIQLAEKRAKLNDFVNEPAENSETENRTMANEKNTPETVEVVDDTKNYRFGNFLVDIINAAKTGNRSERLQRHQRKAKAEYRAILGNSESVPSSGGFLVDQDMGGFIADKTYNNNVLVNKARKFPISSNANGIKIPGFDESSRADGSRFGGTRGYWVAEGASKTASSPDFRLVDLSLNKLVVLNYLTDELLNDSTAIESFVTMAATEELNFKIQNAIINGTGAGQPLGILNSPCVVSVAKESGQSAKTINYQNIVKMYARAYAPSNRAGKIWICNQDIIPQLMQLSLAVGTGGSAVFLPSTGLNDRPYDTLFGIPIIYVEQAATLGTVGDIILADMSHYYIADKGGLQAASSIHVQFTTDQTVLRWVYRIDGQPSWDSALTPFKGSNTKSPFVTLATRS